MLEEETIESPSILPMEALCHLEERLSMARVATMCSRSSAATLLMRSPSAHQESRLAQRPRTSATSKGSALMDRAATTRLPSTAPCRLLRQFLEEQETTRSPSAPEVTVLIVMLLTT